MNNHLTLLQHSITNFIILELTYKSGEGVFSEREVEPLALIFEQGEWKLVALCRLRSEERVFLLNRVADLKETSKGFAPNQFNLKDFYRKSSLF